MTPTPRLTRSDAWIVAALCETHHDAPMRLRELIYDADWLNRAVLSFDELSFGLPRLEAVGLVEVSRGIDGPLVRATTEARALRATVQADSLVELLARMAGVVAAAPYPEPEAEDRSLGRLPGFDEAQWRAEVAGYRRAFRADLGKLAAAFTAIVAGAFAWIIAFALRRRGR